MNILFTSAGRRSYLIEYFREALNGEGKIYAMNSEDLSPALAVADESIISPMIYDENYIPFVLSYCKSKKIDAVISLFDADLPVLSKNIEKFQKIGTNVLVAPYDVIQICNDKWKTYKFLSENNIDTPRTFIVIDEAKKAIKDGIIHYPVIIKPRWGMGSIGIYEADNEQEIDVLYNKVKRKIQNSYLKFESKENIERSVLIQEKINGQEYGMDVVNNLKGEFVITSVKEKIAMRSGETDCSVTIRNDKISQIGEKLSLLMKHKANLDVDLFVTDEKIFVLEMNARFGGGYPFSHIAGLNLPLAIVKWLKNEEVSSSILTTQANIYGQKDIKIIQLQPQMIKVDK